MCNFEHTMRPSPMMWPCMHTKGGMLGACQRKSLFTSHEWTPSTQLSIAITPSLLLESGVWRTVSRFQILLGLSASLTSRVSRQRSGFAQEASYVDTGESELNIFGPSRTTHLLASFSWPWSTMAYSVFQDLSNLAATPGPGSLSNQALA